MTIQWLEVLFWAIFSFLQDSNESWSKLTINQLAISLVFQIILTGPKVIWARFFYVSTPFLLVMAAAAAAAASDDPKSCFDAATNRTASTLGVGATSFYSGYMRAKTHMGLDPFEVRFFFWEKITTFNLALKPVIKNRSKFSKNSLQCLQRCERRIFFLLQNSYGNTTRLFFFYTIFFFS